MSKTAALILAGGKTTPEMREAAGGVANRALVSFNGRTMLDYVVTAVRGGLPGHNDAGRILVAGDVPTPAGCEAVPGGTSLVDTLLNGVSVLGPDETRLLVATSDIPFLTVEAVRDFVEQTATTPAAFYYPIVRAEVCAARFPDMRRTTLRIAEGTFTGGNLALLDPAFLRRREATLRAAYARRKSVTALARMLGPGLLFRLVVSRLHPRALAIPHLEAAVSRLLGGAAVRAVISPFAEVGADVDRPEDVVLARAYLEKPADTG